MAFLTSLSVSYKRRPFGNTMPSKVSVLFGLLCVFFLINTQRAAHGSEAHTHGVATLTIALIDGTLEAQLESPAMSLLGFEHAPKTKHHEVTISKVKLILNSPDQVFSFDDATCSNQQADIQFSGPVSQEIYDLDEHGDGDHDEAEKHAEHHGDHDNEYDQSHSELSAMYVFTCTGAVSALDISLFRLFPSIEKISVNWVTESQQGQSVLRPTSSTLKLN